MNLTFLFSTVEIRMYFMKVKLVLGDPIENLLSNTNVIILILMRMLALINLLLNQKLKHINWIKVVVNKNNTLELSQLKSNCRFLC